MKRLSGEKQKAKEWFTRSEQETFSVAKSLAKKFKEKEVILLVGELGAGKTVFAKGIAAGLGLEDIHQVCSPSFTLVNIYQARVPIFHIDLYRLENPDEILDLGWEDYLGRGVVIVEWAEKIGFDIEGFWVKIEVGRGDERKITVSPPDSILEQQ
jgi:tRNA threonylcarbamoyladenosine biosynthesis protein TsaE